MIGALKNLIVQKKTVLLKKKPALTNSKPDQKKMKKITDLRWLYLTKV